MYRIPSRNEYLHHMHLALETQHRGWVCLGLVNPKQKDHHDASYLLLVHSFASNMLVDQLKRNHGEKRGIKWVVFFYLSGFV